MDAMIRVPVIKQQHDKNNIKAPSISNICAQSVCHQLCRHMFEKGGWCAPVSLLLYDTLCQGSQAYLFLQWATFDICLGC